MWKMRSSVWRRQTEGFLISQQCLNMSLEVNLLKWWTYLRFDFYKFCEFGTVSQIRGSEKSQQKKKKKKMHVKINNLLIYCVRAFLELDFVFMFLYAFAKFILAIPNQSIFSGNFLPAKLSSREITNCVKKWDPRI